MSTVKYTNDCKAVSSAVLSEVLRYALAKKPAHPPLTVTTPTAFFQPQGSSLPRTERLKPSKEFLLTRRSLGSSSSVVHQCGLNLAIR